MQPIANYPAMDCRALIRERAVVQAWKQHHGEMNAYMADQASTMGSLDAMTSILSALGSAVDPRMAGMYQANDQMSRNTTAQVQTSQAQAAAHEAGLNRRQAALGQLIQVKGCT